MNAALDERVLEASVAAALERIRAEQVKFPDQRVAMERELSLIQTRLHHLVELIANGKGTGSVVNSLHQEESRKRAISGELDRLDSLAHVVSLDAKRLVKDLRSRLEDIPLRCLLGMCLKHVTCLESFWMDTLCVSRS